LHWVLFAVLPNAAPAAHGRCFNLYIYMPLYTIWDAHVFHIAKWYAVKGDTLIFFICIYPISYIIYEYGYKVQLADHYRLYRKSAMHETFISPHEL